MPKKRQNQKFKCSSQALSQNENAFNISLHTSWFNINILANFLALKVFNLMIFALAECVCKYKFSTFLMSLSIFSFCTYCGSFYCRSGAPSVLPFLYFAFCVWPKNVGVFIAGVVLHHVAPIDAIFPAALHETRPRLLTAKERTKEEKSKEKHRHRRNVTSYRSFSLL